MGCCCFASTPEIMNGEKVDLSHFVVGNCIGKGGFGKVHAVLHKGTGVQMAMKRLQKSKIVGKGEWYTNAVWIERNLLELLQTPYSNRLYFAFQNEWELFLIMPYYRGGDLSWYLSTYGKLKTNEIKYYAAELLIALKELRRLNIVYRDFKPENCLFNDDGHLSITDFGICGQLTKENGYKLRERFGTTCYMSPNQYKGKTYDYSCDYFAFGLVLYAMAMAKSLHSGSVRNIETETNEWYKNKMDDIQCVILRDLILSLLEVNREKRLGVNDIEEIFQHKFFDGINFDEMKECKQTIKPPHIPNVEQLNCSLENLALDAMTEFDPTEPEKPSIGQQKTFDLFEFNTKIKNEWITYWDEILQIKSNKERDERIQSLWDKSVDTNAFNKPKSEISESIDFDTTHIEITKPMIAQIYHYNSKTSLIQDSEIENKPIIRAVIEE